MQSGWRLGGKGATGRDPTRGYGILEHGLHLWLGFYDNAFAMVRDLYAHWDGPSQGPQRALETAFAPSHDVRLFGGTPGREQCWTLRFPELPGRPWDAVPDARPAWLTLCARWLRMLPELAQGVPPEDRPTLFGLGRTIVRGLAYEWSRWGEATWDRMDQEDFRGWLKRHGGSQDQAFSPPVSALYDLGFAYPPGHTREGRAAAGVALRVLLRMFTGYRGAPMWRMTAGMGDTIFAPAWDVLRARGVNIALFHHVLNLGVARDLVERVEVGIQARGVRGYDPLIDVGDVRAWPASPIRARLSDLAEGELDGDDPPALRRQTLERGRDFDAVVLAIPAAAQRNCAAELARSSPRYAAMLEHSHSIATIAAQVWFSRPAATLGPDARASVTTGQPGLFRTQANMTEVLAAEAWRESPRHLAYLCGAAPPSVSSAPDRAQANARLRRLADTWLRDGAADGWPGARTASGRLDEAALHVDPGGRTPDAIYLRANAAAWERYVLSLPGTTRFRLPPGGSGFANLFLAGDWTRTAINGGSVEAAVSSGVEAAAAIEASLG